MEISQHVRLSRAGLVRELNSGMAESTSLIAHHRHAVRLELAAQLKQALRAATAEIHSRISEAMLKGNREVAERLESERQTVQIVISAIDAMANRLFTRDLAAAAHRQGRIPLHLPDLNPISIPPLIQLLLTHGSPLFSAFAHFRTGVNDGETRNRQVELSNIINSRVHP